MGAAEVDRSGIFCIVRMYEHEIPWIVGLFIDGSSGEVPLRHTASNIESL